MNTQLTKEQLEEINKDISEVLTKHNVSLNIGQVINIVPNAPIPTPTGTEPEETKEATGNESK